MTSPNSSPRRSLKLLPSPFFPVSTGSPEILRTEETPLPPYPRALSPLRREDRRGLPNGQYYDYITKTGGVGLLTRQRRIAITNSRRNSHNMWERSSAVRQCWSHKQALQQIRRASCPLRTSLWRRHCSSNFWTSSRIGSTAANRSSALSSLVASL